jgi:hypothetical protein
LTGVRYLPVVALRDATIHGNTGIGKALKVLLRRSRPLGSKNGSLRFVGEIVPNSELLADTTLEIDVGPSVTCVFLHGNYVDFEPTLAEFFLEVRVGGCWDGLDEHLHGVFEVIEVLLVGGSFEKSPCFLR